jgi:hypothetical protein
MGWERSWLGYSIGDEVQDGAYRRTAFENGFIRWTGAGGAQGIKTSRAQAEGGGFAFIPVDGLKALADVPPQPVVLYEDPFAFAPSELCARFLDRPGLDATIRDTLIARIRGKLLRASGFIRRPTTSLARLAARAPSSQSACRSGSLYPTTAYLFE